MLFQGPIKLLIKYFFKLHTNDLIFISFKNKIIFIQSFLLFNLFIIKPVFLSIRQINRF